MEVLRYLGAALTRNWGLKLLALALAIVLYHTMKPAENSRTHENHDRSLFQKQP